MKIDPDERAEQSHADECTQADKFEQCESNERVENRASLRLLCQRPCLTAKGIKEMRLSHPGGERVEVENFGGHLPCPHPIRRVSDERQRKGVAEAHQ